MINQGEKKGRGLGQEGGIKMWVSLLKRDLDQKLLRRTGPRWAERGAGERKACQ